MVALVYNFKQLNIKSHMCYTAILPTTACMGNENSALLNLTYVFNRWLKMLTNYGKLDEAGLQEDFAVIASVLRSREISKEIKRAVQRCRDYALSEKNRIDELVSPKRDCWLPLFFVT